MKWISVENRLPEVGERVLTWAVGFSEGDVEIEIETYYGNDTWQKSYIITHWMPLPEPPEEA